MMALIHNRIVSETGIVLIDGDKPISQADAEDILAAFNPEAMKAERINWILADIEAINRRDANEAIAANRRAFMARRAWRQRKLAGFPRILMCEGEQVDVSSDDEQMRRDMSHPDPYDPE